MNSPMTDLEFRVHLLQRRMTMLESKLLRTQIWIKNSYYFIMAAAGLSAGLLLSLHASPKATPEPEFVTSRYDNITLWGFL